MKRMERTDQQNTWESRVRTVRPGGADQQGQDSPLGSGGDLSVEKETSSWMKETLVLLVYWCLGDLQGIVD
jgi:hypothetical protein